MRRLLAVCVAVIAVLSIVSAHLWLELRSERQVIADLRTQMTQPGPVAPAPAPVQIPQPVAAQTAVPDAAVQDSGASQAPAAAQPAPAPAVAQVVIPIRPPTVVTEARRQSALMQSEQTATARVLAWKDRLAIAGHTLTTEQLQALNAAATAELRRETEESLELEVRSQPTDLESAIRMREETINRQNETNRRILAAMSPHLNEEQSRALRAQFDAGHAARMATFRSEQEMLRQSQ